MKLNLHQPGNDVYYETAEFTNTYSSTSYELPFTKTVKQGGNTAPGKEKFALEIFDVGVSSMEAHAKDLYTATVTTKGAGTYDGKLIISGPADQVERPPARASMSGKRTAARTTGRMTTRCGTSSRSTSKPAARPWSMSRSPPPIRRWKRP